MSMEKMIKPVRSKGENTFGWISRRDSYRIQVMEEQLENLTQQVKKLQNEKRPRK